jgi:hypothetical protein
MKIQTEYTLIIHNKTRTKTDLIDHLFPQYLTGID